jgi:drug/metabolite transporter (DMT)-like permease|tara:strand:+ start:852 stop:1727 length:876 start_codon:yes stop_codon:yes gene_type:complete
MQLSENIKGAIFMSVNMLAFVVNDAFMKFLFIDISIYQAIFLRGVITIPMLALMAVYRNQITFSVNKSDWKYIWLRVAGEVGAAVFFLSALAQIPLANVTAILQAVPLTVTMAAALFLRETVGWRRWLAIIIGFLGVTIIVRPGVDGFSVYSLYAIAAVFCVTIRDIATRKLSKDVPTSLVALITGVAITLYGAIMLPSVAWIPLTATHWFLLTLAAIAIVFGYVFSVLAMRTGETSFIAPFRYTAMIWAIGLGIILFNDWPDNLTLLGTTIVIATGIYSFHREKVRQGNN